MDGQQKPDDWRVFGDFGELEHVCDLIREDARLPEGLGPEHPVHQNGPIRELRKRLRAQWDPQAAEVEALRPGLFPRTYLADIYAKTDELLERIEERPDALKAEAGRLELLLHKVFIFSLSDDDALRAAMQAVLREHQSNAGSAPKGSAGIRAAVKHLLQQGDGTIGQSAEQMWLKLNKYQEESPLKVDGYQVFMDTEDGKAKLCSMYEDGRPDGRSLARRSFDRVFSKVKNSLAVAG